MHLFLWSREDLQNLFFFAQETGLYFIKLIILNLVLMLFDHGFASFLLIRSLQRLCCEAFEPIQLPTHQKTNIANKITLADNANTCKCSTCIKLPMCYRGKKHNTLFFTKLISAQNLIMIKDSAQASVMTTFDIYL